MQPFSIKQLRARRTDSLHKLQRCGEVQPFSLTVLASKQARSGAPEFRLKNVVVKSIDLCKNEVLAVRDQVVPGCGEEAGLEFPLSKDEHVAMLRCLSGVRRQLQDVSDLFSTRYGKESSIAELSIKALISATLLEHELMIMETEPVQLSAEPAPSTSAAA